jgi:hypothetical protein
MSNSRIMRLELAHGEATASSKPKVKFITLKPSRKAQLFNTNAISLLMLGIIC